jgi:hypothetical protein
MTDPPVVLIFFNRPQLLQQLWQVLEQVQPSNVIAISDGARSEAEQTLVQQCRAIIAPTWDCEVTRIYQEQNLGLRKNIITGLNEVFSVHEAAIVLEDDCIPHPEFFRWCAELLLHYRDDSRIFSITGTNQFADQLAANDSDYDFSRYFCSWGWAAWRRSWQMCKWSEYPSLSDFENAAPKSVLGRAPEFWRRLLRKKERMEKLNSWAFQACLTAWEANQLTIFPSSNKVTNIGLDSGTHFKPNRLLNWKMPALKPSRFPIAHATKIEPNDRYDALFEARHFEPSMVRKLISRLTPSR